MSSRARSRFSDCMVPFKMGQPVVSWIHCLEDNRLVLIDGRRDDDWSYVIRWRRERIQDGHTVKGDSRDISDGDT
jgi:hypothetical protein